MIKKSRLGLIRTMAVTAQKANLRINKSDQRLSHIINSHLYFTWDSEQDLTEFLIIYLKKIQGRL